MSLLLLDRAQLQVQAEGDTLALYEAGTRRGTVPLKLLQRCVIHGASTQLNSGVLLKLAEAGVTTVLMSPRQSRRVATLLGPWHNDAAVRLAQAQRVLDPAACQSWASKLVAAKLRRQRRTLERLLHARPDARKPLWDALQTVATAAHSLHHPPEPLGLQRLLGIEGSAARAYFSGLAVVSQNVVPI